MNGTRGNHRHRNRNRPPYGWARCLLPLLTVAASWYGFPAPAALAAEAVWDASTYLQVPVHLGSDTRLVMPEPFDDSWEHESDVACTLLDPRTLIIRPRTGNIEQRLTLRGRRSGTLYLARVSSALPYAPVITVRNAVTGHDDAAAGHAPPGVLGLLKAMMQGHTPAGYQVQHSDRVLFDHAPYRIVAQEVWRSRRQTGILAQISTANPSQPVPIVPANLLIHIPELGSLRALAADEFELRSSRLSTNVYLVYVK
jgi:hypothetical protein